MRTFLVNCAVVLAFATTGFVTNSSLAVAAEVTNLVEEIVVRAPTKVERHEYRGISSSSMSKVEIVELKRTVSFADLDLSSEADVMMLEQRIETVAQDSCEKLSDMFPLDRSSKSELRYCMNEAIESALEAKERAIAAAH